MSAGSWKELDSRVDREGFVTVRSNRYELPDATIKEFDVVSIGTDSAAAILALTPDGRVVIARQYRWGPDRIMHDLPAGMIEHGESALDAAERELREETGYVSDEWVSLGSSPVLASLSFVKHFFLARNCSRIGDQDLDASEFIEVELLDHETFERVVAQGLCHDAEAWFRACARGLVCRGGDSNPRTY